MVVPCVGDRLLIKWTDGSSHKAEVVERRNSPSAPPNSTSTTPSFYSYYVHYIGFDRRLDTWVPSSRCLLDSIESSAALQEQQTALDAGRTRNNKRRSDADTDPAVAQLEKEHEELTKVKNISKIQIGSYEVDTWYYSPFPEEFAVVSLRKRAQEST